MMITRRHALATLLPVSRRPPCCKPSRRRLDRLHLRSRRYAGAGARVPGDRRAGRRRRPTASFLLKYHLGGALTIKGTDITTAVGDNVIQIGDDGIQQGNVPITGILRLPMLITNPQEFDKALAVMKPYVDRPTTSRARRC